MVKQKVYGRNALKKKGFLQLQKTPWLLEAVRSASLHYPVLDIISNNSAQSQSKAHY